MFFNRIVLQMLRSSSLSFRFKVDFLSMVSLRFRYLLGITSYLLLREKACVNLEREELPQNQK